jgi:hypothetical protein
MLLCRYKNIFGEVRKGFHAPRIMNMAMNDWIGTFLLAYIYGRYTSTPYIQSLLIVFVVGQLCHFLFCVDTTIMKYIVCTQ